MNGGSSSNSKRFLSKKKKKREEKKEAAVKKTKAGAILREIIETDWEEYGYVLEGLKKRKTYQCKQCNTVNIRGNHRNVHKCKIV